MGRNGRGAGGLGRPPLSSEVATAKAAPIYGVSPSAGDRSQPVNSIPQCPQRVELVLVGVRDIRSRDHTADTEHPRTSILVVATDLGAKDRARHIAVGYIEGTLGIDVTGRAYIPPGYIPDPQTGGTAGVAAGPPKQWRWRLG